MKIPPDFPRRSPANSKVHGSENTELSQRLTAFLKAQTGANVRVSGLERYPVGFSWLTYGFEADGLEPLTPRGQQLILRIGPEHGLFAPYSAREQFIALKALEHSGVPVPKVYWYSNDMSLMGGVFFIMEKVAGEAPLPWTVGGQGAFDESTRPAIAQQFVSALAKLGNFKWQGTAAEGLDNPASEAAAALHQIEWWERHLRRRELRLYPIMERALLWLRANAPTAPRISIVHGDYRIGNFLVHNKKVSAILDWELVHLGDAQEDLGWMCMRPFRGRSPRMCHLLERSELFERYEALTGIRVEPSTVHYYEVFGNVKLAIIHVMASRSFEDGGFNDLRMPAMGFQIPRMLLQIDRSLADEG